MKFKPAKYVKFRLKREAEVDQFETSGFLIHDTIDSMLADFFYPPPRFQVLDSEITANYLKISHAPSCFATKLSKVKFLKPVQVARVP